MPLCHLLLVNTNLYSAGQKSATISNVREVTLLNSIINKKKWMITLLKGSTWVPHAHFWAFSVTHARSVTSR